MSDDGKKDTAKQKQAARARATAFISLMKAYKAYQRWQVADCVAKDTHIDAGDAQSFTDWVKDEIK